MTEPNTARAPREGRTHMTEHEAAGAESGTIPWSEVDERLARARNYWVGTASPQGVPHATPVWAIWLDGTLYFDGSPETRWGRNIATNPRAVVYLESGDDVVILEGPIEDIPRLDPELFARVSTISQEKYGWTGEDHGCFALRPRVAQTWRRAARDATSYGFDGGEPSANAQRAPTRIDE